MKYVKKYLVMLLSAAMIFAGTGSTITASAAVKTVIRLNKTSVTVREGSKKTLKVTTKNVQKIKSAKWSVKNKKVATVTQRGSVKGIRIGKTTVTCKVSYLPKGAKKSKSKTLKAAVTVTAKKPADTATPKPAGTATPDQTEEPIQTEAPIQTEEPTQTEAPAQTEEPTQTTAPIPGETKGPEATVPPSEEPTPVPDSPDNFDMTALEFASKLGVGINAGNSLDSFNLGSADSGPYMEGSAGLALETSWGCPKINADYIKGIKAAGFTTVRIPVSYVNHVKTVTGDDGTKTYTIDETWLNRVQQVVDYAMGEDLYVIINIHHDGGDTSTGDVINLYNGEQGTWLSPLNHSGEAYQQMEAKFTGLWKQIAVRFKDYSNHLMFEDMNEYHHGYDNPEAVWITAQNNLHQAFVDVVRSTGGNNEGRYLIIPSYNTNIDHAVKYLEMPTDISKNQSQYNNNTVGHLLTEVHYYDPYTYAADNPSDNVWGSGSGSASTWANEAYLENQMKKMKDKFVDRGIPVILGEYGAAEHTAIDKDTDAKYRTYYYANVVKGAVKNGLVPIAWDNGTSFQLISRQNGSVTQSSIVEAVIRQAKTPDAAIAEPWE